jgi:hypothetical protein
MRSFAQSLTNAEWQQTVVETRVRGLEGGASHQPVSSSSSQSTGPDKVVLQTLRSERYIEGLIGLSPHCFGALLRALHTHVVTAHIEGNHRSAPYTAIVLTDQDPLSMNADVRGTVGFHGEVSGEYAIGVVKDTDAPVLVGHGCGEGSDRIGRCASDHFVDSTWWRELGPSAFENAVLTWKMPARAIIQSNYPHALSVNYYSLVPHKRNMEFCCRFGIICDRARWEVCGGVSKYLYHIGSEMDEQFVAVIRGDVGAWTGRRPEDRPVFLDCEATWD